MGNLVRIGTIARKAPICLPLDHPQVLDCKWTNLGWVAENHNVPSWASMSSEETRKALSSAWEIYENLLWKDPDLPFSKDFITLADGKVFFKSLARGNEAQFFGSGNEKFFKATSGLNQHTSIHKNKREYFRWLRSNSNRGLSLMQIPNLKVACLGFLLVATAGFTSWQYNFLQSGFQILQSQGPKAAYDFFVKSPETPDAVFGKAWSSYRLGEFKEAEDLINQVQQFGRETDKPKINFLLGAIANEEGEFGEAEEYLLTARALYSGMEKEISLKGTFRSNMLLARMYIEKRELYNAEYSLNLASNFPESHLDNQFLYLWSRVHYLKNDFDNALEITRKRLEASGQDDSKLAGVYSDLGFYSGLVGDYENCLAYTMESQKLAGSQGNKLIHIYNQVNMLLYSKCTRRDASVELQAIEAFAFSSGDKQLKSFLYDVQKFQCPETRPDPGNNGDPPPGLTNSETQQPLNRVIKKKSDLRKK